MTRSELLHDPRFDTNATRYSGWRAMLRPRVLVLLMAIIWLYGFVTQYGMEIINPGYIDDWSIWRIRAMSTTATLSVIMSMIVASVIAGLFILVHRIRKGQFHDYSLTSLLILAIVMQLVMTSTIHRDDGIRIWSDELGAADFAERKAKEPPRSSVQWNDPTGRYTVDFRATPTKHEVGGAYAYQAQGSLKGYPVLYALTVTPIPMTTGTYDEQQFLEDAHSAFLQSLGVHPSNAKILRTTYGDGRQELGYMFTGATNGMAIASIGFWIIDGDHTIRVSILHDASMPDVDAILLSRFLGSFELVEQE